ncbi:MAG: hypothetical protein WCO56_25450, partial [Verrucomicrobiota bacterium]
ETWTARLRAPQSYSTHVRLPIFMPQNISAKVGFGLRTWHLLVLNFLPAIFMPWNVSAMSGFPSVVKIVIKNHFHTIFTQNV